MEHEFHLVRLSMKHRCSVALGETVKTEGLFEEVKAHRCHTLPGYWRLSDPSLHSSFFKAEYLVRCPGQGGFIRRSFSGTLFPRNPNIYTLLTNRCEQGRCRGGEGGIREVKPAMTRT